MGWFVIHAKSGNKKLNTKSSAETEVFGTREYFPYEIWLIMLLLQQGYRIVNNTLYQDNQSAIKTERKGRNYCTVNSEHTNLRYFFVKDRFGKGEVNIEYWSTKKILADFFTNPCSVPRLASAATLARGPRPWRGFTHRCRM